VKEEFSLSFENKAALVTGAGSGMGLATAKAFAEAGASVALADVNEESVRAAAKGLVSAGRKAFAVRCDVADDQQVAALAEQTVSTFRQLDAAFNTASPLIEENPQRDQILEQTASTRRAVIVTRDDYDAGRQR
jgi:NAD(P)-dependent dehydrogenase (short-subunit alcohol dehydrogenase family)